MAHFRKQLRDGSKARLASLQPYLVRTLSQGRLIPVRDIECPAVNILTFGDDGDEQRKNVDRQARTVPLSFQILVSGRQDATQDDADAIAEAIESLMVLSPEWSFPVRSLTYLNTVPDMESGAEGALFSLTVNYLAEVVTPIGAPGTPLISAQRS